MYNVHVILIDSLGDMQKKNTPNAKDSSDKKSSSSKLIKFTAGAAMIASIFSTNLSPSQNARYKINGQQKNMIELLEKKDSIDTINYNIDNVEHEKLLNETITEVNIFRQKNGLTELIYEPKLEKIAQQYANYCAKNNWKE